MTDDRFENARAQREAVDSTVNRTSRGPVSRAVQDAFARYLAAESYRDRSPRAGTRPEPEPGSESESESGSDDGT